MKKSELKQIIKEEISRVLKESIINDFKKDVEEAGAKYAYISSDGDNRIKIYLDNEPNKEKNIINKVVRNKYIDKLTKIRSEEDIMIFKIK
jgi:hypothetical protein